MLLTIVAGARPNFMKVAPLIRECERRGVDYRFVHTGQHYDFSMSEDFIRTLGLPEPDANLEVGSGTACYQCGEVTLRMEQELVAHPPDAVLVVGDVNGTLGTAVAASKLFIPLAHVEAGLRSFNRTMPEELNRIATDALADFLFTTEESGSENLLREGRDPESIFFVGNTMIDSLVYSLESRGRTDVLDRLGLRKREYCYVTLHRPSNVDEPGRLVAVLEMLRRISTRTQVVFPVHPRTRARIEEGGLSGVLDGANTVDPVGYLDSITLTSGARFVLTDSGGLQEEATFLKVPCLTLRPETERPVTVEVGTNLLVSENCAAISNAALEILDGAEMKGEVPPLWDGKAASRIIDVLQEKLI
jgi:UDP-N-acetylglucosamine 2-epimerase (non-hydrolysing)